VRRSHIVLYGNFGVGNLGNDSSLEAMLHAIKRYRPEASVICVCHGPHGVEERYGIPTQPVDISAARLRQPAGGGLWRRATAAADRLLDEVAFWVRRPNWLRTAGQFIVVGTGVLDDMGVRPWNAPFDLLKWCLAARLSGTQVVFLSVGAGPIENPLSRILMLTALRLGNYRSYRDRVSLEYLRGVGFNTQHDRVYPDLVFSLPVRLAHPPRAPWAPPRTVGLGVMGYYGWRNDPQSGQAIYAAYLDKLKCFLRWLLDRGYQVRLLTGELPRDQRPVNDLLASVSGEEPRDLHDSVIAEAIGSADDLLEQIAQTDLVVATRFHNVLCALMVGRPVISLGYAKKNDALLTEMGLQAYCHHVEQFSVQELMLQFEALAGDLDRAVERIQCRTEEYRRLLDEQYRAVLMTELDPVGTG
jgi:polysaccharide pyruvyl transferase WcaK-like protein